MGVMVLSFLAFNVVPGTVQLIGSGLILAGVSLILFRPLLHLYPTYVEDGEVVRTR